MATELFRKQMISAYREMREAELFLSGFFDVRPENISATEKVALDVVRNDEQISPVVNTCEGPTFNTNDRFTTKEFTPPSINEAMPFDCKQLLKRQPGETEYEATNTSFQASLVTQVLQGMVLLENKMRRNREWQASQILQTGVLTLQDEDGNDVYTIDYQAKPGHFFAASVGWAGGAGTPLIDIETAADLIRDDSLQDADRLIFGTTAFNGFIQNSNVQAQLDNRRFRIGEIAPEPRGQGAKFMGVINIGAYQFEMWTFNGRGIAPDGTAVRFVGVNNCIVMASSARLDTVFAGVPRPVPIDPRFAGFLPERIAVPAAVDIAPNIYATQNGKQTILELESRPLLIPTAIDSFATIDAS
ncbi:MAG: major capsid protein [Planctomycetota bacterium]